MVLGIIQNGWRANWKGRTSKIPNTILEVCVSGTISSTLDTKHILLQTNTVIIV